jgi:hypothetical protein
MEPTWNGTWTVNGAPKASRGKFGQWLTSFKNANGQELTIWSYKHSCVLSSIKILP